MDDCRVRRWAFSAGKLVSIWVKVETMVEQDEA